MKNKFKWIAVLLVLTLATLSAGLGAHIIELNRIHQKEVHALRQDLLEDQDRLDKAKWNTEMTNWQLENLQPSDDR